MDKDQKKMWEDLQKPFPKEAYKDVKFGRGFTTIDAYHIVERLTDVFGLCGEGWGFGSMEFQAHGSNVACIGSIWFEPSSKETRTGAPGRVHAVGDAQVIKGNIAEAYKKAQTNMMSKAASYLGVGLSIYQGKGLDDPYLDRAATTRRDISEPRRTKQDVKTDDLEKDDIPW